MKISAKGGIIDIKKQINKKRMIIMMSIIIFTLVVCTPMVFAKYNATDILKSSNKIAKPIFMVEGTETSKISEINSVGYYEFTIKNFNELEVSEVGFLYTIEVISNTDDSIQFELYNGEKQIPLENLKTDKLSISGNERTEQKYKLKVTYDSSKGAKGKDILEEVQIKVHSEQEKI